LSQNNVRNLQLVGAPDAHVVSTRSGSDIPDWSFQAVSSLLQGLSLVDPLTYAHCLRVGAAAKRLARAAGLDEYNQNVAEFSGLLHDIGKMGIDPEVIHKPASLSEAEYKLVMSHPVLSEKIIQPLLGASFFKDISFGVRSHHERVDGRGYPDRLKGDEIPLMARVVLVVDTLDAMSQERSYRKAMPLEAVYQELQKCAGTQFDPQLVKIFVESHKFWATEAKGRL